VLLKFSYGTPLIFIKIKKPPPVYTDGGFLWDLYNNLPYGINRYVCEPTTTMTTRFKRTGDMLCKGFINYLYQILVKMNKLNA
jgi:hypothetical protein